MPKVIALVGTLLVFACGDATGPKDPSVTGTWNSVGDILGLQLTLSEVPTGYLVTGHGSLVVSVSGREMGLLVTDGIHFFPDLRLTFQHFFSTRPPTQQVGLTDIVLIGTVTSGSTIEALLNGAGFKDVSVSLSKKQRSRRFTN